MDTQNQVLALYGYVPTRSVCYLFVTLYSISTLLHAAQAFRFRTWWLFPTVVIAGAAEVVGWAFRLVSSYNLDEKNPYVIQISILILAPTPFVAALFIGMGRVTERLGAEYSRLSPKLYSRIFLTGDIFSLLVQGAGGGIATTNTSDPSKARLGGNVILAGLGIQIASMTVFSVLMIEYAWRRINNRPFHKSQASKDVFTLSRHIKMLIAGVCISTVLIYIRSIFRVIEFADGFNGTIAHTQVLFNVFDGMLVTLAIYTLNFMHPGWLLAVSASESTEEHSMTSRNNLYP